MTSMHFTDFNFRRQANADPYPVQFVELARLHDMFKVSPVLTQVLIAMTRFSDPRLLTDPKQVLLFKREADNIEVRLPYRSWTDGPRCVPVREDAYKESANRRNAAYAPAYEVFTEKCISQYGETGQVKFCDNVVAASVAPSPIQVSVCLGNVSTLRRTLNNWQEVLESLLYAHRKFCLEIHNIHIDGEIFDTREFFKKQNKITKAIPLFKQKGEDPGGVFGLLELELRKTKLIQRNIISITTLPYHEQTMVWEANKSDILRFANRKSTKFLSWAKKKELMQEFQTFHDGISFKPRPKVAVKHKSKKRKIEAQPLVFDKHRNGAAKASMKELQTPQIILGAASSSRKKALLVATSEYLNSCMSSLSELESMYHTVFVLETSMNDVCTESAYICLLQHRNCGCPNIRVLFLTHEVEMENVALLVQWLPLIDFKFNGDVEHCQRNLELQNLKAWCTRRARTTRAQLDADADMMEENVVTDRKKYIYGVRKLPAFAALCKMKDIVQMHPEQDLVPDLSKGSKYYDVKQADQLHKMAEKTYAFVTKHMKG